MPNRDKTGPEGRGSKTGRGLGDCKAVIDLVSGFFRRDDGFGLGRGGRPRGGGRSWGRGRNLRRGGE